VSGSFSVKRLRASLILPQGVFAGTNSNTLVIDNLRMSAKLECASGNFTNFCAIQIWGMQQVDMNSVTVLFGQDGNAQNVAALAVLRLEVGGDTPNSWLQIFSGQFQEASPDYRSIPEVCLTVTAATGYGAQILPVPPISVRGPAAIASLASQIAQKLGFPLENNGVTGVLSSPYFVGTLMEQWRQLMEAARTDFYFDANGTLVICPRGQGRQGRVAVAINAQSGMVGYPTLNRFGCTVKVVFNPAIALGAPVQIQGSEVPGCDGLWFPRTMRHDIDTIKPAGQWFTTLELSPFAAVAPS
jgi:hypothetical protein